jgi:DNA-binding transcriptional MerR regulator
LLLEVGDVTRELACGATTVRVFVERGLLIPVGRTRRGVNLFAAADVERLRLARARAAKPKRVIRPL